jgi:hypothetical protein
MIKIYLCTTQEGMGWKFYIIPSLAFGPDRKGRFYVELAWFWFRCGLYKER